MPSVVLRRQISGSRSTESATFKNMEKSTIIWYTGIPVFFSITAMYFVYNFRATWLIRLWQRYGYDVMSNDFYICCKNATAYIATFYVYC